MMKTVYRYYGEENLLVSHSGKEMYGIGQGMPYNAQYLFAYENKLIQDYESGKFTAKPEEPKPLTPLESLYYLKEQYPDESLRIDNFIKDNKESLNSELFAADLQAFINNVTEVNESNNNNEVSN